MNCFFQWPTRVTTNHDCTSKHDFIWSTCIQNFLDAPIFKTLWEGYNFRKHSWAQNNHQHVATARYSCSIYWRYCMFIQINLAGSEFSRGTLPTMHSIYVYTDIYQGLKFFANSYIYNCFFLGYGRRENCRDPEWMALPYFSVVFTWCYLLWVWLTQCWVWSWAHTWAVIGLSQSDSKGFFSGFSAKIIFPAKICVVERVDHAPLVPETG